MPIFAYVGRPRSGKSYEVVSVVILGALRDGRRVVSNIAGLDYPAMVDMLLAEGIPIEKIGKLVSVTNEQVAKPSFWRTDKDEASGFESFIQPGDLVALDEIWRFFPRGRGAIEPRAQNFFRMHGHMPDPKTGYICQVSLSSQSIRDFNGNVCDVVEQTYCMVKLSKLGLDKSYRVEIYEGGSVRRVDFIRELVRQYDARYFPLYSSHSQKKDGAAEADEKKADDRGNIFKSALFRLGLPLAAVMFLLGGFGLYRYFNPPNKKPPEVAEASATPVSAPDKQKPATPEKPKQADDWRVAGFVDSGAGSIFVLDGGEKRTRLLVDPPKSKVTRWTAEVMLPDGEFAVSWTRPSHGEGLLSGGTK